MEMSSKSRVIVVMSGSSLPAQPNLQNARLNALCLLANQFTTISSDNNKVQKRLNTKAISSKIEIRVKLTKCLSNDAF